MKFDVFMDMMAIMGGHRAKRLLNGFGLFWTFIGRLHCHVDPIDATLSITAKGYAMWSSFVLKTEDQWMCSSSNLIAK